MAYSPLAQAGRLRNGLLKKRSSQRNCTCSQYQLGTSIVGVGNQPSGVMAIPKAATIAHVQQNAAVLEVELSPAELAMLDKAYPAPKGKTALDMV